MDGIQDSFESRVELLAHGRQVELVQRVVRGILRIIPMSCVVRKFRPLIRLLLAGN